MIRNTDSFRAKRRRRLLLLITSAVLILLPLVGCGPSTEDLLAVEYTPLPGDDWKVPTPAEQGLDPLYGQTGDEPWNHEKAIINLVAEFINSLPSE